MRLSADGGRTWEAVCDGLPPLTVDGKLGSWHHGRVTELAPGICSARSGGSTAPTPPADDQPGDDGYAAEPHLPDGFVRRRPHLDQSARGGHAALPVRRADGRALVLADGDYLAVVSEAWKTYDDASYGEHSGILSISHDGGYTFEPSVAVAHDPANRLLFWDERLAVDPESGRLIGMFWTHDREAGQDRNAHIAWAKTLDGTSWTYPIDAGFAGQIPRPLPLPGGRVLCVYVHRHRPPSLRAILSPDFGQTWDAAGELVFYEHPFGPQAGMDVSQRGFTDYYADQRLWNFGHVEPGLLPDGSRRLCSRSTRATPQSLERPLGAVHPALEPVHSASLPDAGVIGSMSCPTDPDSPAGRRSLNEGGHPWIVVNVFSPRRSGGGRTARRSI